jgi:Asp-tRNA(Asn)/Glu-tRNA(Gln) amidotransferase A subunit family amidase
VNAIGQISKASAAGLIHSSARALIQGMRSGELSARAVMEAHLARIAEREPVVRAWAFITPERGLQAADHADAARAAGKPLGPLHGLPVGVKDIIDTLDMPTEFGTPLHKGRQPAADATIVTRLRTAGAIILGKTVTSEHAVYTPGPTRNPHDPSRTPGGSSSGSAAAVADGMVPVALATQTNGSTIRPASFCGVVGYKPSLGVLPRTGVLAQTFMLDQPGIIARNVADAALIVDAMAGRDAADEWSLPSPAPPLLDAALAPAVRPRLGLVRGPYWDRADPEVRSAIETFAASLGQVDVLDLPSTFSAAEATLGVIMNSGIAHAYRHDFERGAAMMADVLVNIIKRGQGLSAYDVLEAFEARDRMRQTFDAIAAPYDAVMTAAAVGIAPPRSQGTGDPIFATTWTLIGAPTVTLPLLEGTGGMPIGVQLVGRGRDDAGLLRAAAWLEQTTRGAR